MTAPVSRRPQRPDAHPSYVRTDPGAGIAHSLPGDESGTGPRETLLIPNAHSRARGATIRLHFHSWRLLPARVSARLKSPHCSVSAVWARFIALPIRT